MRMKFFEKLTQRIRKIDSILAVGIDPRKGQLKQPYHETLTDYCKQLIAQTNLYAAAYKLNIAFFERFGWQGLRSLEEVIHTIPDDIPIILDVKRGDIAATAEAYANAYFDNLGVDAVTVNPYMGRDAISPFSKYHERGVFLLCKTSNPGAADLQDLVIQTNTSGEQTLYQRVGLLAEELNKNKNIGLVIGATQVASIREMRSLLPETWFLTPGIGAQGGNAAKCIEAGIRKDGLGLLIPVSRGISQSENPEKLAMLYRDRFNYARDNAKISQVKKPDAGISDLEKQEIALGLFDAGCIQFGEFTLKSGLKSPFYIDLRRLVSYPGLLAKVAAAYVKIIKPLKFDVLAGIPYAGLPIATAVGLSAGWRVIYPRKEQKAYGTKSKTEGVYAPGETAVIIDDLITTGGSKTEVITRLQEVGLKANAVVVLIDRRSKTARTDSQSRYTVKSVLDIYELLEIYRQTGRIQNDQIQSATAFLEK